MDTPDGINAEDYALLVKTLTLKAELEAVQAELNARAPQIFRQVVEERSIPQYKLAEELDVSPTWVNKFIRGVTHPGLVVWERLRTYLEGEQTIR